MLPQAYSQRKAQRMQAAEQHISILKRAVQDEPDGFLDADSQPALTKLLKADEKQFSKAERDYTFKGSREPVQALAC